MRTIQQSTAHKNKVTHDWWSCVILHVHEMSWNKNLKKIFSSIPTFCQIATGSTRLKAYNNDWKLEQTHTHRKREREREEKRVQLWRRQYLQVMLRYASASGGRPMPLVGRQRYQPVSSRSARTITSAPSLAIWARDMRPGTRRTSTPLRNHCWVMFAGLAAASQSRRTRDPSRPVVFRGRTIIYAFAAAYNSALNNVYTLAEPILNYIRPCSIEMWALA